jgi:hypothetical protein
MAQPKRNWTRDKNFNEDITTRKEREHFRWDWRKLTYSRALGSLTRILSRASLIFIIFFSAFGFAATLQGQLGKHDE